MHPPDSDIVIVRHGEIGIKSEQVRRKMERQLADNVRSMLASREISGHVERRRNRLYVHTEAVSRATNAVSDVFGVVSVSPATTVEPTLDGIFEGLGDATRAAYSGGSFAVRARRAGGQETHPFSSTDIETDGGSVVWETIENMGGDPIVDLDDPDFEVYVDCREQAAYVFYEKREGPGGFPLGTQRPVVVLVSGGIDSPVAAWHVMRRGCPIVPVYVDLGEYGGVDHRARAVLTVESLAGYAPNFDLDLHVVPGGDVVEELVDRTQNTRMLHLRRFLVAVGEAIADDHGATGVVTGESIGQKSSQTSANLAVTDAAIDLPVHRPNVTRDKSEITARARRIGTYEESTIRAGCNRIAPTYPTTDGDLESIRETEPDDLLDRARTVIDRTELIDISPRSTE